MSYMDMWSNYGMDEAEEVRQYLPERRFVSRVHRGLKGVSQGFAIFEDGPRFVPWYDRGEAGWSCFRQGEDPISFSTLDDAHQFLLGFTGMLHWLDGYAAPFQNGEITWRPGKVAHHQIVILRSLGPDRMGEAQYASALVARVFKMNGRLIGNFQDRHGITWAVVKQGDLWVLDK